MINQEKVKGGIEQLKGKDEQAVVKAIGTNETQVRGKVHEARGKAPEKVTVVKSKVQVAFDEAGEKNTKMKRED